MNSMSWKPAMERPRIAAKSAVRSSNVDSVPRCHGSRGRGCKKQVTDQSRRSERQQASKSWLFITLDQTPIETIRRGSEPMGMRLIGISVSVWTRARARRLPSRVHDVKYLVVSVRRVEPSGRELRVTDSRAKRDYRLIDDHGFAVHRRMPG